MERKNIERTLSCPAECAEACRGLKLSCGAAGEAVREGG
jgi:hypothetical protein